MCITISTKQYIAKTLREIRQDNKKVESMLKNANGDSKITQEALELTCLTNKKLEVLQQLCKGN